MLPSVNQDKHVENRQPSWIRLWGFLAGSFGTETNWRPWKRQQQTFFQKKNFPFGWGVWADEEWLAMDFHQKKNWGELEWVEVSKGQSGTKLPSPHAAKCNQKGTTSQQPDENWPPLPDFVRRFSLPWVEKGAKLCWSRPGIRLEDTFYPPPCLSLLPSLVKTLPPPHETSPPLMCRPLWLVTPMDITSLFTAAHGDNGSEVLGLCD